ncbi:MAG: hypothetical protein ABL865_03390 [Candidatus Nitrotoga sp.]
MRQRIEAALKPGYVIKLLVKFPQAAKEKYLVLVEADDPEFLTFIINTAIHPFIASRQHLRQCQVAIDAASHDFLDHDSHIACHNVLPVKREEVIKSLMANPAGIKGNVSPDIRSQILSTVKFAKTIDKDKKNRIIAALGA